jgi:DNA-binding transcriptional LysR family regulator
MKNTLHSFDLNLLVIMHALLEKKHVTRAAERLGVSQPSVSKALDKLRCVFSDKLLIREKKGYVLTPTAHRLLAVMDEIMPLLNSIIGNVTFAPETSNRIFKISITDFGLFVIIPKLMPKIINLGPKISLTPFNSDVLSDINAFKIDLALFEYPPSLELNSYMIAKSQYKCLVNSKTCPHIGKLSLDEYAKYNHVKVLSPGMHKTSLDLTLEHFAINRIIKAYAPSFYAAALIVSFSNCITTIPEILAETLVKLANVKAIDPPDELGHLSLYAGWHHYMDNDNGHKWLRSLIIPGSEDPNDELV